MKSRPSGPESSELSTLSVGCVRGTTAGESSLMAVGQPLMVVVFLEVYCTGPQRRRQSEGLRVVVRVEVVGEGSVGVGILGNQSWLYSRHSRRWRAKQAL